MDLSSDLLSFNSFYSLDSGLTWSEATILGKINNISNLEYTGTFQWNSAADTEGIDDSENLLFKVVPFDVDSGQVDIIGFHLDNNRPPTVAIFNLNLELFQ